MPYHAAAQVRLAALAAAVLVTAAGCGDNACTNRGERLAECFGSDEEGEPTPDDECTGDAEKEAECIVDASCDDINSGKAFTDCATKK